MGDEVLARLDIDRPAEDSLVTGPVLPSRTKVVGVAAKAMVVVTAEATEEFSL